MHLLAAILARVTLLLAGGCAVECLLRHSVLLLMLGLLCAGLAEFLFLVEGA